ncbi:hypothetical protein [Rhodoferax sp.]|uniref:hypothetical protein n=1 Tax=Rhodoferax sp. TaxID=50421 RepID=UPI002617D211|nr:hypothetical protein [Rhodoferax sp.]MDD2808773.1 hypothetical protein [Rhodoferax sp.]
MNHKEFTANHLINFSEEQLEEMFDWDEVKKLPNDNVERQRVEWLSQFLIGNVSEPFEDIKKLDKAERRKVFETWIDLIQDIDTARGLFKSVLVEFIM